MCIRDSLCHSANGLTEHGVFSSLEQAKDQTHAVMTLSLIHIYLWGVQHPIQKVDIILTKSMFKGYGWLTGSGMSWEDYWAVFLSLIHI